LEEQKVTRITIDTMSEQPLYTYWDEQALSDAASSGQQQDAGQQSQQQQQLQSHYFQHRQESNSSSQHSSQHHPLDNLVYSTSNNNHGQYQEDQFQALMMNPSVVRNQGTAAAAAAAVVDSIEPPRGSSGVERGQGLGQNQLAVLQLQQNLMLMLQQQQEQSMKSGEGSSSGSRLRMNQHPQQSSQSSHANALPKQDGETVKKQHGSEDPNMDLQRQYRHLFGTPLEGGASQASGGESTNRNSRGKHLPSDEVSPSSSRLFAIGAMVQPLSSDKPQHVISARGENKTPEITASSLGMSESSIDFMMKLFQDENAKLSDLTQQSSYDNSTGLFLQQQQQQQQKQLYQPPTVASAQGISVSQRTFWNSQFFDPTYYPHLVSLIV
jgi:hypothetical protein